jgi:hypothetical protein
MAQDDAIVKLARQIDAARKAERFLVNADEVASLRRHAACEFARDLINHSGLPVVNGGSLPFFMTRQNERARASSSEARVYGEFGPFFIGPTKRVMVDRLRLLCCARGLGSQLMASSGPFYRPSIKRTRTMELQLRNLQPARKNAPTHG